MNWKAWLGYNAYKKLWSLLGGRPWTFVARDIYHKFEYVVLMGLLIVGYHARELLSHREFYWTLGAITLGYIWGHFFWGKEWEEGQQGR